MNLKKERDKLSNEQITRLWHLERWLDEPFMESDSGTRTYSSLPRDFTRTEIVIAARAINAATDADVYDYLLGKDFHPDPLREFTRKKPSQTMQQNPWLIDIAARCRDQVVDLYLSNTTKFNLASELVRFIIHGKPPALPGD